MHFLRSKPILWALVTGLLCALIYAPIENTSDAAAVMQRGDSGEWIREESTAFRFGFSFSKGTATKRKRSSHSVLSTRKPVLPIPIQRIWIVNRSTGPFAREVGRTIQERLLADPLLDEVAYFPASDLPLRVNRPPHLYLSYRAEVASNQHWPWLHAWTGSVQWNLGTVPMAHGNCPFPEEASPQYSGRFEFTEKNWGVVTYGKRYEGGIASLHSSLAIEEQIELWRGPAALPQVPLAWAQPSPPPPTDLASIGLLPENLTVAVAPAPLQRHFTWVTPITDDSPRPVLEAVKQLEADGWTFSYGFPKDDVSRHTNRGRKGERRIHLHNPIESRTTSPSREWVAHLVEVPTAEELLAWVQTRWKQGEHLDELEWLLRGLIQHDRRELLRAMRHAQVSLPRLEAALEQGREPHPEAKH